MTDVLFELRERARRRQPRIVLPEATDERVVWVLAPPSSSAVTTSLVTVFTTSGPVTNM